MGNKKQGLDIILSKFKLNQRYHIQLIIMAFFANLANTTYYSNYIFTFEEVNYRCVTQNTSQGFCTLPSNETCTEWIYDKPDSLVAEFNLACQDWKRTTVGTVHGFGYMFGLLLIGPISDRLLLSFCDKSRDLSYERTFTLFLWDKTASLIEWRTRLTASTNRRTDISVMNIDICISGSGFGRKSVVVITGTLGAIFGILKSFSNWYILYIVLEFLEASIGDLYSPMYVLALELVAREKRTSFVLFAHFGFTFGRILFASIAWLVPHRRTLLRVIYAPGLLFTLYSFLLDESPRWLLIQGRRDSAVAILEKAAKTNKMTLEESTLEKITINSDEEETKNDGLQRTFKSGLLRGRLCVCVIWWITATFVSFGLRINSVSLNGNKHLNFILLNLPEIPATFVFMYILKHYKRKKPLISCFLVAATFCLVQPFTPSDMPWLSNLLFFAGHTMSAFFFSIVYLYTSELFPTYSRNSMHALCSSLGRIGSLLAPQTPLLRRYWSGLPPLTFGLVSLLAGLVTFLVPDVGDDPLPDTVRQAEAVGKPQILEERRNEDTLNKLL